MQVNRPVSNQTEAAPEEGLIASAREAAEVLAQYAAEVDETGSFPAAGMLELKRRGFMGLLVPHEYGGLGASYATLVEIARILSEACLSTGMIWAMHCQQVAVLVDHTSHQAPESVLSRIAAEGLFVASVTSERGKGGHLLTALAPLVWDGNDVILTREAPVVTGGAYADAYLITMRASETAPPSEVKLVYAVRDQLELKTNTGWNAMGMRGTQSVGMSLQARVPKEQVLNLESDFNAIATSTLIPVGHISWAACWLGAASGAFRHILHILRNPSSRKQFPLDSDLFVERLAQIRLQLDTVSAYLRQVVQEYESIRCDPGEGGQRFNAVPFHIHLNNLKILASETLFEAINQLVKLSGLQYGYLKHSDASIERVFRDLRSASLMYANDRLLIANGKLALLDREVTLA